MMTTNSKEYFISTDYLSDSQADSPDPRELISEIIPVIPVVCRQLNESVTHVRASVELVCESFNAISEVAQKSVGRSSRLIDESAGEGEGLRPLIETTRSIIENLLAHSMQSLEKQVEMADKIASVEQEVRSIKTIVEKIYSMSQSLKVLAINAQIEASRAGSAGRTFAVVAGETKKVAVNASEMNGTIRVISDQLESEVRHISDTLRVRAESEHLRVESARILVENTLAKLSTASDAIRVEIELANSEAAQVTKLVGDAIVNLQFQDAVSQRVGNAIGALEDIESELISSSTDFNPNRGIGEKWENRLQSKFTMASEHQALGKQVACGSANIELF